MIIIDLEWNRGYDKTPLQEILQIGAVRVEALGGPILDAFTVFIRPRAHKKLNRTAKALPELQQSLRSLTAFAEALAAFNDWCAGETVFADWGGDDFEVLRQNCAYWGLPAPKPVQLIDLQAAFSLRLGARQGLALYRAVEYCGIPDAFTYHNALNDAMYTALVAAWIPRSALSLLSFPKEVRRLADGPPFPPQPRRQVGPFPSPQAALNGRSARRQFCPLCGEPVWVRRWYFSSPDLYYADFRCRAHGSFLCRLTLTPTDSGQWQGRLSVPSVTPSLLQEFDGALRAGAVDCRSSPGKRRKRRRRPPRRTFKEAGRVPKETKL